ncbi:unnamed protein product [Prunus armeniaca]
MVKFKCNDRDRVRAVCAGNCNWVCFASAVNGSEWGCRPVIGFDACHIKGHHPRQLLSAVGVDHNNGMYPIAYAVAEVENYETWS